MGIGRKYREELLEKRHQEWLERVKHSNHPEWVHNEYDHPYEQEVNTLGCSVKLMIILLTAALAGLGLIYLFR